MGTLIDISSHNRIDNWSAVRDAEVEGTYVKLTQATNYTNPVAGRQIDGSRSVGIPVGGYHFGDPRVDAVAQADRFGLTLRSFGLTGHDSLAAMFDAENWPEGGLVWANPTVLNTHIAKHIDRLRSQHGVRKQIVYASLSWWTDEFLRPDQWADDDVYLWVAVYNNRPGSMPRWTHPRTALHQFTSDSTLPGNPGRFDRNVFTNGHTIGDLTMSTVDPAKVWAQTVSVAAPADRNYREERPASEVMGDAMYFASTLWHNDVPALRLKLDTMEAEMANLRADVRSILSKVIALGPPSEV